MNRLQNMTNDDWRRLTCEAGCLDLACLTPDLLRPGQLDDLLSAWQSRGNAGALDYIDSRRDILAEPFASRPWARAALVLSFAPRPDPDSPIRRLPPARPGFPAALVAPYALNEDYHVTGARILERLIQRLTELAPDIEPPQFEPCTDSRPVMEKQLALLAGLGTQGLNSLIRNDTHGCCLHLAVLFTSLPLAPRLLPGHTPAVSCQDCRRCLTQCPTGAFAPGRFQVRRCRAWLASEFRRPLSREQRLLLGDTLFGCGRCTLACPAPPQSASIVPPSPIQEIQPYAADAWQIATMPSGELTRLIRGSILQRTGATLLKRNAVAAIANQTPPDRWPEARARLLAATASPTVIDTLNA
ncbi:MAG: epoxyqueuosine reductase [Oligosphaeraceae bacterium]